MLYYACVIVGVGVLVPFTPPKFTEGGLDNDKGQLRQFYRFGSVRFGSVRFGSAGA